MWSQFAGCLRQQSGCWFSFFCWQIVVVCAISVTSIKPMLTYGNNMHKRSNMFHQRNISVATCSISPHPTPTSISNVASCWRASAQERYLAPPHPTVPAYLAIPCTTSKYTIAKNDNPSRAASQPIAINNSMKFGDDMYLISTHAWQYMALLGPSRLAGQFFSMVFPAFSSHSWGLSGSSRFTRSSSSWSLAAEPAPQREGWMVRAIYGWIDLENKDQPCSWLNFHNIIFIYDGIRIWWYFVMCVQYAWYDFMKYDMI